MFQKKSTHLADYPECIAQLDPAVRLTIIGDGLASRVVRQAFESNSGAPGLESLSQLRLVARMLVGIDGRPGDTPQGMVEELLAPYTRNERQLGRIAAHEADYEPLLGLALDYEVEGVTIGQNGQPTLDFEAFVNPLFADILRNEPIPEGVEIPPGVFAA